MWGQGWGVRVCLPVDVGAGVGVAGTVGLWSWQRSTEVVWIGLVVYGAEDDAGLVA